MNKEETEEDIRSICRTVNVTAKELGLPIPEALEYLDISKKEYERSKGHLDNVIFRMYLVTENYCAKYSLGAEEFLALDERYDILGIYGRVPMGV